MRREISIMRWMGPTMRCETKRLAAAAAITEAHVARKSEMVKAVMVWTETVAIRITTKAAKRRHWSLRHRARHTAASTRTGWRYILTAPSIPIYTRRRALTAPVELIPDA